MPDSPPESASPTRQRWLVAVPVVVALVYAWGHLNWYLGTPLGRVPVLDERENLRLAEQIFQGSLPAEQFYRAQGYALLLAGFRGLGLPTGGLFSAALVLGSLLHAVNAGLTAAIARRWFGPAAALAAGLLLALNPVLVHYATQALDAVPALTCFLAGLAFIAPSLTTPGAVSPTRWAAASLSWAAATLLRPNYLLVWLTLPLLAWWLSRPRVPRGAPRPQVPYWVTCGPLVAALAGAVLFFAMAGWQRSVSGAAGFLPWQGAYNLWASNQPGTHGRYYTQHASLPPVLAEINPARAESMLLYQTETGRPPTNIARMNEHWRARFLGYVVQHPFAWFGQLGRKLYALLNDWEQYNNKTYAFHQALSPWLRWNPLGWGLLFVLGLAGAVRLVAHSPRTAAALALVTAAATASILLFFVSARFRLPLAALATVLAGGALGAPGFWSAWTRPRQLALGVLLVAGAFLTFSNFDDVRSRATFVQDHTLLARAAASVGDDALAWREAQGALALQPGHPDALRLAVASYFNQLLEGAAAPAHESRWRECCLQLLDERRTDAPDLQAVAVLAVWRAGHHDVAVAAWRQLGDTPSALAARVLAHDPTATTSALAALPPEAWAQPLFRLAAVQLDISPPSGVMLAAPAPATGQVQRLFAPTSP